MAKSLTLEIGRILDKIVGQSVSFGSTDEYYEVAGLQSIGDIQATVEMGRYTVHIKLKGKGIDAVWCPFSKTIRGKGSKKYTEELARVGRDAVAWFTSELDPTDPPEVEPEEVPENAGIVLHCPHCKTPNVFPKEYAHRKKCDLCSDNLHMIDGKLYNATPKNGGQLTKKELERVADGFTLPGHSNTGAFICDPDYKMFADLDGKEARRYLESRGFTVTENKDTGHNGYALTSCGLKLSTNGYLHRVKE